MARFPFMGITTTTQLRESDSLLFEKLQNHSYHKINHQSQIYDFLEFLAENRCILE
jgi:hypothetical protein